jgi:YHS domain-containing protein
MQWLSQYGIWILLAVGLLLLMRRGGMACGMGSHGHMAHDRSTHADGGPLDAVNGHSIKSENALTSVFEGKTYFFESDQSRSEFQKDPQRFIHEGVRHHHGGC